jgi:hypothetical protein
MEHFNQWETENMNTEIIFVISNGRENHSLLWVNECSELSY